MKPKTSRPNRIREQLTRIEENDELRAAEVEVLRRAVKHLQDTVDQMQAVLECGDHPAPVFLRWEHEEDGVSTARFGSWSLEVTTSGPSWSISNRNGKVLDAGYSGAHFETGMDLAEKALRRLIQEKSLTARSARGGRIGDQRDPDG